MFRIVSYNVHRCLGVDGVLSPERIAETIASLQPDIVALQEIDVGRNRTGRIDQAAIIAGLLNMEPHFYPAFRDRDELYGDLVLSAHPSRWIKGEPLPSLPRWPGRLEKRGAVWVSVDVAGQDLQIINTHLSVVARERRLQVDSLLSEQWLGNAACRAPFILLGDFNAVPGSGAHTRLSTLFLDTQRTLPRMKRLPTFPVQFPVLRLDHIFLSDGIEVLNVDVPRTALTLVASDHLPVVADLKLPVPAVL